jgi:hypothetical protein
MKPKHVKRALLDLPSSLDETYERMLVSIDEMLRPEARTLLLWLAYAQLPPTLEELSEASIIDPTGGGKVEVDNRGGIMDALEILAGLVVCGRAVDNDEVDDDNRSYDGIDENTYDYGFRDGEDRHECEESNIVPPTLLGHTIDKNSRVRLAHFSVKEYLESKRIVQSNASYFFTESGAAHRFLAQSCLTYIMHYSNSSEKTSSTADLNRFPLLMYTAKSWFFHSSFQHSADVSREVLLLGSEDMKRDWLWVHCPDAHRDKPFQNLRDTGSGIYYASFLGLHTVVRELLLRGADINAQGGNYSTALYAASSRGHEKVVQMLIDAGADVLQRSWRSYPPSATGGIFSRRGEGGGNANC